MAKDPNKPKKPFYTRWWFIVLVVLIVVGVFASMGGDSDSGSSSSSSADSSKPEEKITYTPYTLNEMFTDLDENAISAEEKYQNQYVEVSGVITNFDSDGKYFSIGDPDDEYSFDSIQIYLKDDSQKDILKQLKKGELVTVKGKIKSIGEVLGYSMDAEEIIPG